MPPSGTQVPYSEAQVPPSDAKMNPSEAQMPSSEVLSPISVELFLIYLFPMHILSQTIGSEARLQVVTPF